MKWTLTAVMAILLATTAAQAGSKNDNTNTNININTAIAKAVAKAAVKLNVKINNSSSSASSAAGGGSWADAPYMGGGGSGVQGGGGGGSNPGGGVFFSQPDAGGNWGLYPNTLDTGHAIVRGLPSTAKWDVDLDCKTATSTLHVAIATGGEGDMLVTERDPMGITWDRFEQYGDISLKKVNDGMYEWKGRRHGSPGVQITGTLIKHDDKHYYYIEDMNIAGGTRPFTDAKCTVRQ